MSFILIIFRDTIDDYTLHVIAVSLIMALSVRSSDMKLHTDSTSKVGNISKLPKFHLKFKHIMTDLAGGGVH